MGTRHAHATGNDEQYTPADIVDKVRRVFVGGIDLDPASCVYANLTVGARRIFTKQTNGLVNYWEGPNIFINPPYSRGSILDWAERTVMHHLMYDYDIIWLSNNNSETQAIQTVIRNAAVVHFPRGRIRFINPEREQKTPLQGQLIALLSRKADMQRRFTDIFKDGVNLYGKT